MNKYMSSPCQTSMTLYGMNSEHTCSHLYFVYIVETIYSISLILWDTYKRVVLSSECMYSVLFDSKKFVYRGNSIRDVACTWVPLLMKRLALALRCKVATCFLWEAQGEGLNTWSHTCPT